VKEFWVELKESKSDNLKKTLLKSAAQVCDVLLVEPEDIENAKKTGARVASSSGDCDILIVDSFDGKKVSDLKRMGKAVAVKVTIKGREDEQKIIRALGLSSDYVILNCPDWKVIPLENVIAKAHGRCKLLPEVSNAKEARLALETLELGSDGIVLAASSLDEINETANLVKKETLNISLIPAEIVETKQLGIGARVCVDTCELMKPGEGILVGCQSSGLFLVQAETHESPYVETRPFRVNAGPVSLYVLSPSNKTRYLSELKAGEEILLVDRQGKTRQSNIGRVKIEWRPLILLEAKHGEKTLKTILQNAETIRLVTVDGSKSVTELKQGDKVLVYATEGGRHFGTLVKEETVIER